MSSDLKEIVPTPPVIRVANAGKPMRSTSDRITAFCKRCTGRRILMRVLALRDVS
jgi:hypothetical protein